MLSFWDETLKNISQDQRKDKFVFIINNFRFEVPLSYALAISPHVTQQYLKDPTYNEFEIQDQEKIEEEFSTFLRGQKIRKETFIKIGKLLKNKEMIKKWKMSNQMTEETDINSLKIINKINSKNNEGTEKEVYDIEDIKEEIEYIIKHFEEMKEEVKSLPEEYLIYIIRNGVIKMENEDTLWEIIRERIKEMKRRMHTKGSDKKTIEKIRKIRRILLGSVKIKYLKNETFKEYIGEIEAEDLVDIENIESYRVSSNKEEEEAGDLWNQIQEIILNSIDINSKEEKRKEEKRKEEKRKEECQKSIAIGHKEGKNFEGIIKYLEDKYGKDIHKKGIVNITVSSTYCRKPEKVINYQWNSDWRTVDDSNEQWWSIDFRKMKVKINGYSIKTGNTQYYHLRNWGIEEMKEVSGKQSI